jgi:hypothetical protein
MMQQHNMISENFQGDTLNQDAQVGNNRRNSLFAVSMLSMLDGWQCQDPIVEDPFPVSDDSFQVPRVHMIEQQQFMLPVGQQSFRPVATEMNALYGRHNNTTRTTWPMQDGSESSNSATAVTNTSTSDNEGNDGQQQLLHLQNYIRRVSQSDYSPECSPISPRPINTAKLTPVQLQQLASVPLISSVRHDSPSDLDDDFDDNGETRFKPFHEEKWMTRYEELLVFYKQQGHSAVPHTYPQNPQLARWVKRQRRQHKLRKDRRGSSTMTERRLELLDAVGFIWDSHEVNWKEKLLALEQFERTHHHCNVPSSYSDKKLATWVKCQRRQYKLYWEGKPSAMTTERIVELEKAKFGWEIRCAQPRPLKNTMQSTDY